MGGRRKAHPKPWSLIGRKGPRSVSSSIIRQEHYDYGLPNSPNVLPALFYGDIDGVLLRSPSPACLSIQYTESDHSEKDTDSEYTPSKF